MNKTETMELARAITREARRLNLAVTFSQGYRVVTVERTFAPGDTRAYGLAERDCLAVLTRFPVTGPGTTWGTDSGSVGGHVGLTGGYCRMHTSGVSVRVARAVAGMW